MPVRFELPFAQRSHLVALVCSLLVAVSLSPVFRLDFQDDGLLALALKLTHLGSFSGWFGTQLWVTFIAGVTMFRNLPRHTFGYIQSKLFPKYFLLGTVLTCVAMTTFILHHPFQLWERTQTIQFSMLAISLLMTLFNLLYLEPATTATTFARHEHEKKIKAGQAVGKIEDDKMETLKRDPNYSALTKKFIILHSLASVSNLVSLCMQGVHLLYLASNLRTL